MFKKFENLSKDKQFEKISEGVIRTYFHLDDDVSEFEVFHNKNIKGASGVEHQIDVVYEFKKNGLSKFVLVECKNYNKSLVELGDIRSFYGAIHDICESGMLVEGIFLSSSNYQKGVIKFASHYKIKLSILETGFPTRKEYMDTIFNNSVQSFSEKTIHRLAFLLDIECDPLQALFVSGKDINLLHSRGILNNEIKILTDENFIYIHDLVMNLPYNIEGNYLETRFDFKGIFFHHGIETKIKGIIVYYSCRNEKYTIAINNENRHQEANGFVENLENGVVKFVDRNGVEIEVPINSEYQYTKIRPVSILEGLLTNRQLDVYKLISKGFSESQIADELNITAANAKRHLKNIMKAIDVKSIDELYAYKEPYQSIFD